MAIGALIGGLVQRAGEKSYEAQQQKRNEDLYRQKLQADYLIDDLKTNWDYLDEAGRASRYGLLEPLLGMKKGELGNMATFGEQVYKILPPFQASTPTGTRSSLDQLPQPSETISPSVMAPHTIPTPPERDRSLMMSQIPAVRKLQIKQQADDALRQQALNEISIAPLPPHIRDAAVAKQYGVNAVPILSAEASGQSRENVANINNAAKNARIQGAPRFVMRGGDQLPIYRRGEMETYYDPVVGQEIQYQFQPGDKVYEKTATSGIQLIQDDNGTYAVDKQGAMIGAPGSVNRVPGLTGRPKPQTQLTTITTPQGPALAEYAPARGSGKGRTTIVQQGAVKGTVPAISEAAQKEISGLGLGYKSLNRLQTILPQIATGPVWGRLRTIQLKHLGGWGATPEEVQVATQINMLMRSAFDTAGANFTVPEMDIFRRIYPSDNDTLETALAKIPASIQYIQERMEMRKGAMTPMQRSQTQFPDVGTSGSANWDAEKRARFEAYKQRKAAGGQ